MANSWRILPSRWSNELCLGGGLQIRSQLTRTVTQIDTGVIGLPRWLQKGFVVSLAFLAVIGVFVVGRIVVRSQSTASCEQAVLASAVSPSGARTARHIRLECTNPQRVTHSIVIAPQPPTAVDAYQFFEETSGQRDVIEPAVLSWNLEQQLDVVYPRGIDYIDGVRISGVTLKAAQRVK